MTRDIVDVIKEDIVDMIDNTVRVKEITLDSDPDLRFIVCDLKWMKVGQSLIDENSNSYSVAFIDFETNEVRALRPSPTAVLTKGSVLQIIKPKYYHGTAIVANNEILTGVNHDIRLAVPFIWVKETVTGYSYPEDSSQDFDAEPVIYFLDEINEKALNADQRTQGVKPMLALKEAFYDAIDNGYGVERRTRSFERTISRFGRENEKGMFTYILNANLGGVEIRPTLTVSKSVRCTC